jgi:hypothetical protein
MSEGLYVKLFEDIAFVVFGISIPFVIRKIRLSLSRTPVEYKLSHKLKLKRSEIIAILIWLTGCIAGLLSFFPFDILFFLAGYAIFMISFSSKDEIIKKSEVTLISVFSFLTIFFSFLSAIIFIHYIP